MFGFGKIMQINLKSKILNFYKFYNYILFFEKNSNTKIFETLILEFWKFFNLLHFFIFSKILKISPLSYFV